MAIQGVIYQNQKVSAEDHAALFQMFISDGILSGCGMSKLRNVLTISSGMFVLAGRLSKIIGSEQITIPDTIRPAAGSSTVNVRLTGVIDLNQTASKTEFHQFSFRLDTASNGEYPALRKENINTGNGRYYEVEWAILAIDGDGNIDSYERKIGDSEGTTPSGGGSFISATDFEFSGDPNKILYTSNGTHWEIIILEAANATLTFKKRPGPVDMCLVAAGNTGKHGKNDGTESTYGGNGGEVLTDTGTVLAQGAYTVTIGKADSDPDTSIYNAGGTEPLLKASQANGADNGGKTAGQSGGNGSLAFNGDDDVLNETYKGRRYGAGGGVGAICSRGSNGQDSATSARGAGGTTGGGQGGISYNQNSYEVGAPGLDNTGSGGGGGYRLTAGGIQYGGNGGLGGSGIMLIRDARAAS